MGWTSRLFLALVLGCLSSILLVAAEADSGKMRVIAGTGEAGFEDGSPGAFNKPIRLAPYGAGAVLVADIGNARIRRMRSALVQTVAGSGEVGWQDAEGVEASFHYRWT